MNIGDRVRFHDRYGFGEYLRIIDGMLGTVVPSVVRVGVSVQLDDGRTVQVWAECLELADEPG